MTKGQAHRLFVAVPIPEPARAPIDGLLERLRASATDASAVRWVRPEGLHLTLRFLGWTDPERAAAVGAVVAEVARRQPQFPVAVTGGGAFPSLSRPRVLWLGVADGGERLAALEAAMSGPLDSLGWPPEARPYRAHLTLGRCDGSASAQLTARSLAATAAELHVAFGATELVVMESHLGSGPARYEPYARALLAAPAGGPVGSTV